MNDNNIFCWKLISEVPPPNDIQILVELEREMLGGLYATAVFGKLPLIGSLFAWDAPKPIRWTYIPK